MAAKRIGAMGHGWIHLAMLLHGVGIAMPVDCQHMHVMLLREGWKQIFSHSAKAGLASSVAAIEDSCHKEKESR